MFRASVIFLCGVLAFGVVFSLLPSAAGVARSGVTLNGVQFSLYPEQDQGAVWRFQARQVSIDPLKDENTLDGLGRGERWLRRLDGAETLDLTLATRKLVIDGNDTLSTQQAQMYILDGCYTLNFRSTPGKPVVINQRSGYSAPSVSIASPSLNGEIDDFTSPFDLSNVQGSQRPGFTVQTSPETVCQDGKIVSRRS
ncbi:hypothetical protein [Deinococcus sp.]|uniref:hypothetical protein n=1 Tax=Deinococcus sp. TaxID=47478 RepID=UPI003C7D2B67